ncbi:SPRY domain-containing protein 3 [Orchesella cincta]|uniref:SPRY domain-containing protein 3 n=1 Tax=Orchesella cincta TaxID=48709 RepID=A0A1D2N8J9_ORCCI|nr:SPRY domain-containing protein 3 [Orchesella cincta]
MQYAGIGKSIHDNGFAQSNVPLTPLNHYFEITILDPGESCYIAIGLARKNPGWCRGSIAYHADDGKIFIGGGVGTPFGPRCSIRDVLGCGIMFPVKYGDLPVGSSWPWETEDTSTSTSKVAKSRLPSSRHRRRVREYNIDNFGEMSSESEDDIWWNNRNQVCEDKVQVFFMRNRKLLGIKEVRIPKGGFYPTIGMMSTNERVSVDLHPLTG